MAIDETILAALERERTYQHANVGHRGHTVGEWVLVLQNDIAEAASAWVTVGDAAALCEILQAIATGLACLEEHGVVERGMR